jgi:hypothetical protein
MELYYTARKDNVCRQRVQQNIRHQHSGAHLDIRQSMNENKPAAIVLTVLAIVAAVVLGIWYSGPRRPVDFTTREFFSDDDGTTWFVDDGTKLAPFDHNGKQAVLAKVFQCGNGKMFVGYLEKLSDDTRQKIEAARAAGPVRSGPARADRTGFNGILLKKPGAKEWIKSTDPAAADVEKVTCPDGGTEQTPEFP